LLSSAIFLFLFLVPRTPGELSKLGGTDDIIGALIFASVYIGILTVTPSIILGTMGGIALNLLIQRTDLIRSSAVASAAVGAVVGLVATSLIVAAFLFGLGLGKDYSDLGFFALLIGAIAGSVAGWRLGSVHDI